MSDRSKIQEHLARYVRATDQRDGAAMSKLFLAGGRVNIFYANGGAPQQLGELAGRDAIAGAVVNMMKPHPSRGWSHHTTHDHIIEIDGHRATIDAQFVVYEVQGAERPPDGWPVGAFGAQGTVIPIESGYYRPVLRRTQDGWLFETQNIFLDLPMAFPEA
jgi:SnoaL-like domain